ncbi:hypothetical protein UCDDA912_g07644 [Diaporthe ampelina]|uniref:Uncharacterized protein n=1 Tax=Diaporthe ampelina TaxID=1214573 RepID=A0A0G2FE21_9PEZI|nr:hypothetical protein UCDDA912_g07644 [Diaporthe ampelina]
MQSLTNLVLLASAVTPVFSAVIAPLEKKSVLHIAADVDAGIPFASKVVDSDAYNTFVSTEVVLLEGTDKRQDADPDRNSTIPDVVYTLQCTDDGFRGDCLVFGAKPGACVSYFNFQSGNSTEISDRFNNKVTSLSVNTGGNCQWYLYEGCNDKGDDRGLTSSYNYNLGVAAEDDPRTVEYDNQITSWRC